MQTAQDEAKGAGLANFGMVVAATVTVTDGARLDDRPRTDLRYLPGAGAPS